MDLGDPDVILLLERVTGAEKSLVQQSERIRFLERAVKFLSNSLVETGELPSADVMVQLIGELQIGDAARDERHALARKKSLVPCPGCNAPMSGDILSVCQWCGFKRRP